MYLETCLYLVLMSYKGKKDRGSFSGLTGLLKIVLINYTPIKVKKKQL